MSPDVIERGLWQFFGHLALYLWIAWLLWECLKWAGKRFDHWYSSRPPRRKL